MALQAKTETTTSIPYSPSEVLAEIDDFVSRVTGEAELRPGDLVEIINSMPSQSIGAPDGHPPQGRVMSIPNALGLVDVACINTQAIPMRSQLQVNQCRKVQS